jgi:hypothetical protein
MFESGYIGRGEEYYNIFFEKTTTLPSFPQPGPSSAPRTPPQQIGAFPDPPRDPQQFNQGMGMPRAEDKKGANPATPSKGQTFATIPMQLTKDFLNTVKKGNMSEILAFMSTSCPYCGSAV